MNCLLTKILFAGLMYMFFFFILFFFYCSLHFMPSCESVHELHGYAMFGIRFHIFIFCCYCTEQRLILIQNAYKAKLRVKLKFCYFIKEKKNITANYS